jgi:hypothetical protein
MLKGIKVCWNGEEDITAYHCAGYLHNWFDERKGYWWYRYLYVSRGWRWNERPCTVCFEVCFFRQGVALCLYSRAAVKGTVQTDKKRLKVVWMV